MVHLMVYNGMLEKITKKTQTEVMVENFWKNHHWNSVILQVEKVYKKLLHS